MMNTSGKSVQCVLCEEWFDPEIDGGTFASDGYLCAIGFAMRCEADES